MAHGNVAVGELIRQLRQQHELTQEALAQAIGCSKAQLSLMESGNRSVSVEYARKMEAALEIDDGRIVAALQWSTVPPPIRARIEATQTQASALANRLKRALASDDPVAQLKRLIERERPNIEEPLPLRTFRGIPVINHVAAGYPSEFTDLDYPRAVADEYIACPDVTDPDAFAARVVGDSMEPTYREGDIVVFSPLLPTPSGSDCFVRFERNNQTTFKRIYIEEEGRRIRLQPLNNAYPPQFVEREAVNGMYAATYVMRRVNG